MAEAITVATHPKFDMHRVAWLILIGAFLMFCSSTVSLTGGIYYFLFHSKLPMDSQVQVSRGTAGLVASDFSQQFLTNAFPMPLNNNDTLSTDAQSQAVLTFELPANNSDDDALVLATFTLENSTTLVFSRANRPRFEWSNGIYQVSLTDFVGELDVFVSDVAPRPFRIEIETNQGAKVIIGDAGRYAIQYNGNQLELATRAGRALLIAPHENGNRLVSRGERAIYLVDRNLPVVTDNLTNLLDNSLFAFPEIVAGSELAIPPDWTCSNTSQPPIGSYRYDAWDDRPALRFVRGENADANGQTRCWQDFAGNGRDISDFTLFEIQATFLVAHQSLSTCGVKGTECPLMLFIYYTAQDDNGNTLVDENGNPEIKQWQQGFYAKRAPEDTYPQPLVCTDCPQRFQQHRRIGERVWYTFQSGDLFAQMEDRPQHIQRIELRASGHEYDVYVSEVAAVVGYEGTVPPSVNILPNEEN